MDTCEKTYPAYSGWWKSMFMRFEKKDVLCKFVLEREEVVNV
jgi:hypothetical protein